MQALLLLKATFATWEQKAKILFQLNLFLAWAPSKRTHIQKSTLIDRWTDRRTDRRLLGRQRQRAINHFFVIYAEHQTLPGIRRNNNNNSGVNLTLPSINANKMSWIRCPLARTASLCLLSLSLVCLRLAVIKMNFSIQLNWNVKMLINLSIRWGPSTCPRTVPKKSIRGEGAWSIMKAINLFCMHLSNWLF